MSQRHREPRLEDMLADSIVKAVMVADDVDPSGRDRIAADRRALAKYKGTERVGVENF